MFDQNPIVVIDDDEDDLDIFKHALDSLNRSNQVIWLHNAEQVMEFLVEASPKPFIIFCDINMPKINGIELKKKIDDHPTLKKKCIPFVFYTTSSDPQTVDKAYSELFVQGFFRKDFDPQVIKESLRIILEYWRVCKCPSF
jgi:CheY-like chemotaxis protein